MEWTDVDMRVMHAFAALIQNDHELLTYDVNERTICHHLATHLQEVFPEHHVDVEYNRHGMDPKRVELDPEHGRERVFPDVVVHRRGTDESNLLVMEVKKSTNPQPRSHDRRKLKCCVEEFGYDFAVLVDIPAGGDDRPPCVERVHPPNRCSATADDETRLR